MTKKNYVDNSRLFREVSAYVKAANEAEAQGKEIPVIPDYIAMCFLKIAWGMTRTPKFSRRMNKEDLVMDAVLNCVQRIRNFDPDAETRTGKPNPFAYFTQMTYFAFLRNVETENQMLNTHFDYMEQRAVDSFMNPGDTDMKETLEYLDEVRGPFKEYRNKRAKIAEEKAKEKADAKKAQIEEFMADEESK